MKKLLVVAGLLGSVLASPFPLHSAEPKNPAPPAVTPAKNTTAPDKAARPLPFQGKVSRVSPSAKTFTITTKAGKDHLFTVTDKTQILKEDAPAKFEDIKRDEIVRGSRLKVGENQWEAVKVIIGAKEKAK